MLSPGELVRNLEILPFPYNVAGIKYQTMDSKNPVYYVTGCPPRAGSRCWY